MCRPLWACWVNGRAYAVKGEGSHTEIANRIFAPEQEPVEPWGADKVIPPELLAGLPTIAVDHVDVNTAHPFESRWTTERKALWQPNTARFYALKDVPTAQQFQLAQEQLDMDMGTPDKLRDWVLAAAALYGRAESRGSACRGMGQFLSDAANSVLEMAAQVEAYTVRHVSRDLPAGTVYDPRAWEYVLPNGERLAFRDVRSSTIYELNHDYFEVWAERFSERKNRIPLWAN